MVKTAVLIVVMLVWVAADIGEKKGVTISIEGEGTDLMLATREDLGSFWCGGSCEYVFTTDSKSEDTIWDIVPFQLSDTKCYKIVKAGGYSSGETVGAKENNKWESPYGDDSARVYTDLKSGEDNCWGFEHVGGDQYKIKKILGTSAGKFIRARPTDFKEQSVAKTRRFVEASDDNTYNIWGIKNA